MARRHRSAWRVLILVVPYFHLQAYMHAPISKDTPTYVNQAPGLETVPLNAPNDANPEEYILQVHQAFNGLGIAGNLFYNYLKLKERN